MAQDTHVTPVITSGTDASVEMLLMNDARNIFNAFEQSARGINASDYEGSRAFLAYMRSNYSDYRQNLARLKNPGSEYFTIDSSLGNLINATEACIVESEDNYHYYKILQIYIARKDTKNGSESVRHFVATVNDFYNHTGYIQSNVSLIKTHTGNLGIRTDGLDSGLEHIDYYSQIVLKYIQNQKVGLTKDYSVYDGYGFAGYQEVYSYFVNRDQPVPAPLRYYIVPETKIPTEITVQASNSSYHYLDTIVLTGKLSYSNGTVIPDGRVMISFNDRVYNTTTNESGTYGLRIVIDGPINSYRYNLIASYGGTIAPDAFLMGNSTGLIVKLFLNNVNLTASSPDMNIAVEDNITITGNLTAENGIPVANDIVSAYLEETDSTSNTSISHFIGNGTTDLNGYYRIGYKIPNNLSTGNLTIHTVYYYPSTNLTNVAGSNQVTVSLYPVKPSFKLTGMPLVYFSDDLLGIRGRLILPNSQNISGQKVTASLSGTIIDQDITDKNGVFLLSDVIASDDIPGIMTLTLSTPGNGNTVLASNDTVCKIVVLPYDKTTVLLSLVIALLTLTTIGIIVSIVYSSYRRRTNPDDSGIREER